MVAPSIVEKILKKMYKACVEHNKEQELKMWRKAMKKSLKHKKTQAFQ